MAQFTRRAIMASFLKLVDKKPLDRLTVRDIVEDCEITRNTFYYHFQDIYDLTAEVFRSEIATIVKNRGAGCDHWTLMQDVTDFAMANRGVVLHIYHSSRRADLVRVFENAIDSYLLGLVDAYPESAAVPQEERALLAKILRLGLIGLAGDWLSHGMRQPAGPMLQRLRRLFDGMIQDSLTRAAAADRTDDA